MNSELINVIINSLFYCMWAFYYIKKKGFCINTYPMVLWAISSIASINYFLSPYRFHSFNDEITLIPYIYLFILVWISFIPLIRFDYKKIENITINHSIYKSISWFIILLSCSVFFQNLHYFFNNMLSEQAFLDAYASKHDGTLKIFTGFSNNLMQYCRYFKGLIPIFFIFSFTNFVRSNKYIQIGLLISLMNLFLNYMNTASRFALLTDFLLIFFLYLLLYKYFNTRIKKIANIIGITTASILAIAIIFITLQRFEENSKASGGFDYTLSLYAGESFLNFNGDMWNMSHTTEGENCLGYFIYKFNGEESTVRNYMTLEKIVHRRMNVFYTFIGDYYTDCGRIGTIILVLILTLIFSKVLQAKKSISIGTIILFSTYVKVLLLGYTYWTYLNFTLEFVVNIVIAILFIGIEKIYKPYKQYKSFV